jgi:SecD/SecF fusion protein
VRFNINFIGRKEIWFTISATIIVVGFIVIAVKGLNFGVEFKGGNLFDIKFGEAPTVAQVRTALDPLGLGASVIQPIGKGNELLIRTSRLPRDVQVKVVDTLKTQFKVQDVSIVDVGPGWGRQVTSGAIKALIVSLLLLLIYISFRFEYKMAVAAIIALFHDLLIVLGIYAVVSAGHDVLAGIGLGFLPREVTPNTVAAILTILGFSLYDTIIVFHRIRENTENIGKRTYSEMANDSINQVLVRSINTSITALIPVAVLLFVGGETLKDFAFALVVGLAFGSYSSIFIASPILAMWKETEPRYRVLRERYGKVEEVREEVAVPGPELAPSMVEGLEVAAPKPKPKKYSKKKKRRR